MKVIIVEDEPRVRKGLSESIEWEQLGLVLVGAAVNGLEGLEMFKELEPDLVVADIRMPVMDGLAMTEAILEYKPGTQIIIISGHDEFEYAQRCIALGVMNYLLKPIGKRQFQAELEKVLAEWNHRKQEKEQNIQLKQKLKSNLPIMRNAFLEEWLGGLSVKSEGVLRESCSFLEVPFEFDALAAIAILEPDLEEDNPYTMADHKLFEFAIHNMTKEMLGEMGIAFQRGNGQTVVLYQSVSTDTAKDLILWIERVKSQINSVLRISVTAAVSSHAVHFYELAQLFQEVQRILRLKLSLGTDLILYEGMLKPANQQIGVIQEAEEALLIHNVEMNDECQISVFIDKLFMDWESKNELMYPDEVSFQFTGLFTKLSHRLGKSIHDCLNQEQLEMWRNPEKFRTKDEIKAWWKNRFIELSRSYAGLRMDRRAKMMQQVMDYIDNHIYDNITREDAAKHVYINSSYLSRLFKEVRGEAFSDTVLRKKMEKAIHLLQVERVMVYEVSERLGYKDPSYFARVFKRYTGKSPSEFQ